jgi:hypothetical protein
MRSVAFCVVVLGGWLCTVAAASAETRTFVIADSSDGYGVDQCLATGARCGALIADAYCHSRAFAKAASFHRVRPGEVTGSIAVPAVQRTGGEPFFAIECAR